VRGNTAKVSAELPSMGACYAKRKDEIKMKKLLLMVVLLGTAVLLLGAGAAEYRAGAAEYRAGAAEYRAGAAEYGTRNTDPAAMGRYPMHGFGGPRYDIITTKANGKVHFVGGGGAGRVGNYYIGGFGLGMIPEASEIPSDPILGDLELGFGGLFIGYSPLESGFVHGSITLGLGAGGAGYSESDLFSDEPFYVVMPGFAVDISLLPWMNFSVTGEYLKMYQLDAGSITGSDLDGFGLSFMVQFGG